MKASYIVQTIRPPNTRQKRQQVLLDGGQSFNQFTKTCFTGLYYLIVSGGGGGGANYNFIKSKIIFVTALWAIIIIISRVRDRARARARSMSHIDPAVNAG